MESRLFKKLKRATPGYHWQRHEDKLTPGIPDCSYAYKGTGGWVELKTYDSWPRDPSTPLSFRDLKPQQVNWILRRGRIQGTVWTLLEVAGDVLLLPWYVTPSFGKLSKNGLLAASSAYKSGGIPDNIAEILIQRPFRRRIRRNIE